MNNKFENETAQRKNSQGPPWYDRTLRKNIGLNLCLSILYIKRQVSVFIYSLFMLSSYKTRLKKYFFVFSAKKKPSENASTHIHLKFWNIPSLTDINFESLFLSNHSSTNSCVCPQKMSLEVRHHANRVRNDTYLAKSKRSYFWFALPHTLGTEPLQTIPHSRAQKAGLVLGLSERGW